MDISSDAIYRNVFQSVRWIVCPCCKYFAEVLPVAKGIFSMISALSPHSWLKPLQKALGVHMDEGEVFKECWECLEFSQRTTVLFTSLLKEFEDILEQFEVDTHSQGSSDGCAVPIAQCKGGCYLPITRPKLLCTDTGAKALQPIGAAGHMEPFDKDTFTTTRHKLSTADEKLSLIDHQQLHVCQRGARKRWRLILLVIRAARVLLSFKKPKQSSCPARTRVVSYTAARPPLLPCPPSCVQTQPEVAEVKSTPVMIFSDGPQIRLISQELRTKLESHVRRKRTHCVFGFPPKLAKLLEDSAASELQCQGTGDCRQVPRSFLKNGHT